MRILSCVFVLASLSWAHFCAGADTELATVEVDGQPLGANVLRLDKALAYLGRPLAEATREALQTAAKDRDARRLQQILDPLVLFEVSINPELRVKVTRGPAPAQLQQSGYTPVLVKVLNEGTIANRLRIRSPQIGPVYAGASLGILKRQAQTELNDNENVQGDTDRFLDAEIFRAAPMTPTLSGLAVEYVLALIYSSEQGQREATIGFDI